MADIDMDVDVAVVVPLNIMPVMQDDGLTIEQALVYNFTGIAVQWNFVPAAGPMTTVAVTPTTSGVYDISEPLANVGMYAIEIPASGGASANNDTEGTGWFTGSATGLLPWRGPTIRFRRAALNDLFMEGGTPSTNLEDFFDGTGYAGGTARLKVDVDTIKTQAITCGAGVTVRADVGAAAAPGAANGMLIGGSNTATTFANLTVSGTSALGATTATTIAASGAVTAASLTMSGALQAATIVSTGTTTLNALVVSTTTTLTGVVTATAGIVANAITGTLATVTAVTNAVSANLTQILGTALTETSGLIAAGFKKFFNVATPTGTVNSLPDAVPGAANGLMRTGAANAGTTTLAALTVTGATTHTGGTALGAITGTLPADFITASSIAANAITDAKVASDVTIASVTGAVGSIAANGITATSIAADALNAAAVKADAVTKIQTGLATPSNITSGTITTVSGNVGGNVTGSVGSIFTAGIAAASFAPGAIDAAAIADNAIDAGAIATGAITAAKFAAGAIDAAAIADNAIDAATFAADVDAEAAGWMWNALRDTYKAVDTFGEVATTADVAAAVRDVSNTSPAASSLGEAINNILTDTDAIGITGQGLTSLAQAAQLPTLALTTSTVRADVSNTASAFSTYLTGGDNYWNGALILMTSGALSGQVKEIGDFADTDGIVTLTSGQEFTATPADDVTFTIINR
jgi:hypothetical protein